MSGLILEHCCERGCNRAEIVDEPPIEVHETNKSLQFLDVCGCGPGGNGLHLCLIHAFPSSTNDVAQEGDPGELPLLPLTNSWLLSSVLGDTGT